MLIGDGGVVVAGVVGVHVFVVEGLVSGVAGGILGIVVAGAAAAAFPAPWCCS